MENACKVEFWAILVIANVYLVNDNTWWWVWLLFAFVVLIFGIIMGKLKHDFNIKITKNNK